MNVIITETNEVKSLGIIDNNSGVNWVQDLIGNAGALSDGQFTYDDEANAYIATQDTYDWWQNYITDSNTTAQEVEELAAELGIDKSIISERIAELTGGVSDYGDHRKVAIKAMNEIAAEYAS